MVVSKRAKQRAPRRRWPLCEKRRIVELTLREGASIRAIARERGVHPTSLCHWKALYRAGKLDARLPQAPRAHARASSGTFLPVTITSAVHAPQPARDSGGCDPSIVQITLPSGATLRIEMGVLEAGVVCALVAQLQR
ncbi:MAG: transposase [Candidatus Eremiobacteraeota bacterium]|nr:transposase [Candidatus Eremiobacteraeota bacterium]